MASSTPGAQPDLDDVVGFVQGLSSMDQQLLKARLGAPSRHARDTIWLVIVAAFSIVLVGSFLALMAAHFVAGAVGDTATRSELLLTVFSTSAGFLAGLLSPSPVSESSD